MKRNYYQIEGDTLIGCQSHLNQRHISVREERENKALRQTSYFSIIPFELLETILTFVVKEHSTSDLQSFSRYLFIEFGISVAQHKKQYPSCQKELLVALSKHLSIANPSLFKECGEDRLTRISVCADLHNRYKHSHTPPTQETQIKCIHAILAAQYIEVFAFVNHYLCEHCSKSFADTGRSIDKSWLLESELVAPIFLCQKCQSSVETTKQFVEKQVDSRVLRDYPGLKYRWLTETKLRQFCGIQKNKTTTSFLSKHPLIRGKKYFTRSKEKTSFLLKDVLPYIIEKYRV